jgi:hypothetical protein
LEGPEREVTIRTRARGIAQGKLYRVQPARGATAAYRLEECLAGERRDRGEFFDRDGAVPEQWLEDGPRDSAPELVLRSVEGGNRGRARVTCPVPRALHGEDVVAREIAADPVCLLTEVVLDAHHDPGPLVGHLARQLGGPGQVAIGYIGLPGDTWYWVRRFMEAYPATGDEMNLVLVIEPELLGLLVDGSWILPDGSVDLLAFEMATRGWKAEGTSCGVLADLFEELRALCETTGFRVVLITLDDRAGEGRKPRESGNRFNDGWVRSSIGDAGRFHAHARYRIGRDETVMLKDERHGRHGRFTWRREVVGPKIEL